MYDRLVPQAQQSRSAWVAGRVKHVFLASCRGRTNDVVACWKSMSFIVEDISAAGVFVSVLLLVVKVGGGRMAWCGSPPFLVECMFCFPSLLKLFCQLARALCGGPSEQHSARKAARYFTAIRWKPHVVTQSAAIFAPPYRNSDASATDPNIGLLLHLFSRVPKPTLSLKVAGFFRPLLVVCTTCGLVEFNSCLGGCTTSRHTALLLVAALGSCQL